MRYFVLILFIYISGFLSFAQTPDTAVIKNYEKRIYSLFLNVSDTKNDLIKQTLNDSIFGLFEDALQTEGSFDYSFDSLKYVGKIYSPDKKVRIYTWNLPFSDGTHKYFGFLQVKSGRNDPVVVYRLDDQSEKMISPEKQVLSPENWFGALYYEIIEKKYKGTVYYTLLGFDFNDLFSSKKLVDILYFDDAGKPVFGKPVFSFENRLLNRIIFEFSARVSMSLKYNKEKDMIIYDHLSPSRPSLTGKYQFYGPDFSYDALQFEDGLWKVVTDVDVRNQSY